MGALRNQSRGTRRSIAVAVGLLVSAQYLAAGFAQKGGAGGVFEDLHRATKWHGSADAPISSRDTEDFLKDCKKRFDGLWKRFGQAEKQRQLLEDSGLTQDQRRQVQEDYRKDLKRVASSAKGLRSRIMPLLRGFEDRKELDWSGSASEEGRPSFKSEMEFIRKYIREAEARFYGRRSQVVYYGEENILVCLYWVEQMAEQVRKDLEVRAAASHLLKE